MSREDPLERSAFLHVIGRPAAELLRARGERLTLDNGETLFWQGQRAQSLHILIRGSIGLQADIGTTRTTMVEIFGPGEVFIAPAVILELPYLATALALSPSEVLAVPAEVVQGLMQRDQTFARGMAEQLARHWRLLVEQIVSLKLRSAEQRVARFLAQRAPEEGGLGSAELPEPRPAIAARLGMTPETLSRSLHALEARRCIRLASDRVDILDRDRLLD